MNKHMIFLPVLLTSAVSMHALSFYMDEPEEIVNDSKIQVSTNTTPVTQPVTNTKEPDKTVTVPVTSGDKSTSTETKTETKTVVPVATGNQDTTKPAATNNTQATTTTTPADTVTTTTSTDSATPLPVNTTIKIASGSGLIPSKNFNDIVKEAKVSGGRVDPFLSMKPPVLEKIPELPKTIDDSATSTAFPEIASKGKVTNPPAAWVPDFKEGASKPGKKPVKVASKPGKTTKNGKPVPEGDMIVFTPEVRVEEGLVLTGIITGSKPLALLSVDKENKVYSVGEVIRPVSNIRIVSIDFDTQSVTIADQKNRRARLEIRD
jgi:hypothetical protein